MLEFCILYEQVNIEVLTTDYCSTPSKLNDTYLSQILDSGFDGAYLDVVDAFEYFEEI